MFLTIVLGSQVDHNFIQVVSQMLLVLLFEITQKKLHQKHFTIAKPLLYLELQVKIVRLPAKLCQTGQSSRKCHFWALCNNFCLFRCFRFCLLFRRSPSITEPPAVGRRERLCSQPPTQRAGVRRCFT